MNKLMLLPVLVTTLLLSGCTFTGAHLPTGGKNYVVEGDYSQEKIDQLVDVYPLTPTLVEKMLTPVPQARVNSSYNFV